jgi:hypothetical protein
MRELGTMPRYKSTLLGRIYFSFLKRFFKDLFFSSTQNGNAY